MTKPSRFARLQAWLFRLESGQESACSLNSRRSAATTGGVWGGRDGRFSDRQEPCCPFWFTCDCCNLDTLAPNFPRWDSLPGYTGGCVPPKTPAWQNVPDCGSTRSTLWLNLQLFAGLPGRCGTQASIGCASPNPSIKVESDVPRNPVRGASAAATHQRSGK